jgi:hypothetical protein
MAANVIEICAVRILEHSSVYKDKTLFIAKCTFFCGKKDSASAEAKCPAAKKLGKTRMEQMLGYA